MCTSFSFPADIELLGAGALLRKYINIVCSHVADVLPKAASFAEGGSRQFVLAAHIISKDITGLHFILPTHLEKIIEQFLVVQIQANFFLSSSRVFFFSSSKLRPFSTLVAASPFSPTSSTFSIRSTSTHLRSRKMTFKIWLGLAFGVFLCIFPCNL